MSASHDSAPAFANTLRVRPEVLRVAPEGAAPVWTLRVQAAEAWDAVRVECTPESLVRDVKRAAMANLLPDMPDLDGHAVKLRGAEVDESQSLRGVGAQHASTLVLAAHRRRPLK